ncbi:MAG: carboxypeptidase M32, partial [Clostridia bacterium]
KVLAYRKRFAGYKDATRPVYDVLLDEHEKGMRMETLDRFFAMLRERLVPLIGAVKDQPIDISFLRRPCPIIRQRELSDELMRIMGIDRVHCAIAETEHPFTLSCNKFDVRITTHYHENAFLSSLFSVIHEGGHALYDLGIADEYAYTCLADGASMGMHESQSRLYENMIGHSAPFLRFLYPRLREFFPDAFAGVDGRMFYRAANAVCPSLIRTEADEVTYPLHVMVRYELEKQLVSGSLTVEDLPAAWNTLYKEYLGLDVPSDTMGVLQDMHW